MSPRQKSAELMGYSFAACGSWLASAGNEMQIKERRTMLKTEVDPTDGCTMYTLEKISDIAFLPEDEIPKALEALPAFVCTYRAVLLAAKDEGIEPEALGLMPLKWKVDGASDVLLRSFDGELLAKISTRSAFLDQEGMDDDPREENHAE